MDNRINYSHDFNGSRYHAAQIIINQRAAEMSVAIRPRIYTIVRIHLVHNFFTVTNNSAGHHGDRDLTLHSPTPETFFLNAIEFYIQGIQNGQVDPCILFQVDVDHILRIRLDITVMMGDWQAEALLHMMVLVSVRPHYEHTVVAIAGSWYSINLPGAQELQAQTVQFPSSSQYRSSSGTPQTYISTQSDQATESSSILPTPMPYLSETPLQRDLRELETSIREALITYDSAARPSKSDYVLCRGIMGTQHTHTPAQSGGPTNCYANSSRP